MSAYDELVERLRPIIGDSPGRREAAIAEVLRTLEAVTPRMQAAGAVAPRYAQNKYLAMLRASALSLPKDRPS